LAGERAVGLTCPDALIVRTAWLYAERGRNFVGTMLRIFAERDEIKVVDDQVGTPTYAPNLALALWAFVRGDCSGVFHFTDSGVASWYDFAVAICEEARQQKLIQRTPHIIPISSREFPTPAMRPCYSVLDKSKSWSIPGCPRQHWRGALRDMLQRLKQDG
jgi:dTDP-4-dehydrorhamnose reductase